MDSKLFPISNNPYIPSKINIYIIKEITVAAIEIMCNRFNSDIVSIYSTRIREVKHRVSISRKEVSKNIKDNNIIIDAYISIIIFLPNSMPSIQILKTF